MSRRAQVRVAGLPTRREADGDPLDLRALAGVLLDEGFAACSDRRRLRRAYALWARFFGGPGQTDVGWPKKVSRRAQVRVAGLPTRREADGDPLGLRALAGALLDEGFAACSDRRRLRRACALWARFFGGPGQTDAGWPKKVSRRAQVRVAGLPTRREADGDSLGLRALAGA
ncbi:MAG: hypothetical protein KBB15_06050, partial [Firmicutes bacterium]|nr:hypothetical protein [Bacillota bacterium]